MMNYRLTPFKHQESGIELMMKNRVFGLFDDMGTGKSKTLVDTACALQQRGDINAVVIVCPNTVKANWTDPNGGEIAINGWDNIDHGVFEITSGKKMWPIDKLGAHDLYWAVVNYDAVWRNPAEGWLKAFMQERDTLMALDESQYIKTPSSQRTRGCWRLGRHAVRRILMSGTSVTRDVRDVYAQFRFLDHSILGYPNFASFKRDVIVYDTQGPMIQGSLVKIKEFKNVDMIKDKIAPYYRRVEKSQCLDLPEKVYEKRYVPLSKELGKLYTQMKDKLVVEFKDVTVAATTMLTKLLRLRQLSAGYINHVDDQGLRQTEYFASPKAKEAMQLINDHDGSVIVFYQERPEREILEKALTENGLEYYTLHGAVHIDDRREHVQGFQEGRRPVMLCQQKTGGIGINMTAADLVIFFSNDPGWDIRAQAEDRAHRSGQGKSVTYVDLVSTWNGRPTIDAWILDIIKKKKNASAEVIACDDVQALLDTL